MSSPDLRRSEAPFQVISEYQPSGDQPKAIADLARRVQAGEQDVVLDGSGDVAGLDRQVDAFWDLNVPR